MSDQLNVRNVPGDLKRWIEEQRQKVGVSQNEFILKTLQHASQSSLNMTLPFDREQPLPTSDGGVPFSFVDLFAGIGGFRLALDHFGGKCVFTSEWDTYSQRTYKAWYGDVPHGDITKINPDEIPHHDVLAAGFPCQPFSLAGVSKKNSLGRLHGFKCTTQGSLFFNVATIIEVKRPPVVLLENVKNLTSHDQGRTWATIKDTLDELRYWIFDKVIDAAAWVPQHRERVYIVCFDKEVFIDRPSFKFPDPPRKQPKLGDILEPDPDPKYTLSHHLWTYLQNYAARHKAQGNGFGFGLGAPDGIARTLSARYHKDGSEILIAQAGKPPRRLTPRECARLMGFPDSLPIVVSDTQAYRQFGNAVVPKVAIDVVRKILPVMKNQWEMQNSHCLVKRPPVTSNGAIV